MASRPHARRTSERSRSKGEGASPMVAVVAGATRGAGRGIARGLGETGAIVYCTGRSVAGQPSPYGRPETIDETADLVTAAGGTGIAVRVDHAVESEVASLFERVIREQGRVDVVADSVAGEDPMMGGWGSFWKTDLTRGDVALRQALLSHVITAKHAAPIMIRQRRGVIVQVTEFDLLFSGGNVLAQIVKFALKGLTVIMAEELRAHGVAAVAVTPGFLRSETMLERFGVTEDRWRDGGKRDANFLESESPLFLGRGVAALARDPDVLVRSGDVIASWELARTYAVADHDGRRPDWGRHFAETVLPSQTWLRDGLDRHIAWLDRFAHRAKDYAGLRAEIGRG